MKWSDWERLSVIIISQMCDLSVAEILSKKGWLCIRMSQHMCSWL